MFWSFGKTETESPHEPLSSSPLQPTPRLAQRTSSTRPRNSNKTATSTTASATSTASSNARASTKSKTEAAIPYETQAQGRETVISSKGPRLHSNSIAQNIGNVENKSTVVTKNTNFVSATNGSQFKKLGGSGTFARTSTSNSSSYYNEFDHTTNNDCGNIELQSLIRAEDFAKTSTNNQAPKLQENTTNSFLRVVGDFVSLVCRAFQYHMNYVCMYYPAFCSTISIIFVAIGLWLVLGFVIGNEMESYGRTNPFVQQHMDNVQSILDLHINKVSHWCLGGDDYSCTCDNPLEPLSRSARASWMLAMVRNKLKLQHFVETATNTDVAFLGESIVEEMGGRWLGRSDYSKRLNDLQVMFQKNFNSTNKSVTGITLGIAGDTSSNILWRLMHGELPDDFNPKIWWLSLGMNDLSRMKCSEEVVVIGILRIFEEVRRNRPDAHIVINSLLPMTSFRDVKYPVYSDAEDSSRLIRSRHSFRRHLVQAESNSPFESYINSNLSDIASRMDRVLVTTENDEGVTDQERIGELIRAADKEETNLDKKNARRRRRRKKLFSLKRSRDQILKDTTNFKKYTWGHIRKKSIPLWTSIQAINKQLKEFADSQQSVTYFDATDIFVRPSRSNNGALVLNSKLISATGHPTIEGYALLEEKMIRMIQNILESIHDQQGKKVFQSKIFSNRAIDLDDAISNDDYVNTYKMFRDSGDDDEFMNGNKISNDDNLSFEDDDSNKRIEFNTNEVYEPTFNEDDGNLDDINGETDENLMEENDNSIATDDDLST